MSGLTESGELDVVVDDQMGNTVYFKLRPDHKIKLLFNAYAQRNGTTAQTLIFNIKGTDQSLTYFDSESLIGSFINQMDTLLVQ